MFGFLRKNKNPEFQCNEDELAAMADGELIDAAEVSDPVFAQKMMGETAAFRYDGDEVTICAPCNGKLTVMYPAGHAFGITTAAGKEVLVHIGIDTVNANGDGFKVLHKQGDRVHAGEPVVIVDLKKLSAKYDMSTMLIVTNPNGKTVHFSAPQNVKRGQIVCTFD